MEWSKEQEIAQIEMGLPHLMILGAGASRAAFPNGERNGKVLPSMENFVEVLDLDDILRDVGIESAGRNFEDVYAEIHCEDTLRGTTERLETIVHEYFDSMQLPDVPTLYDHLVLSLREKDVIATFNWDPFLVQACERNSVQFGCPRLLFLHGNVLAGFCENCHVSGSVGRLCGTCNHRFEPSRLLYPISEKDYHLDAFISSQWEYVSKTLKRAFMVTIFGYSAPTSDVSAVELFKEAWGATSSRTMEEIEIINLNPESEFPKWQELIFEDHYQGMKLFSESWAANHPRRTGEAFTNQFEKGRFVKQNPIPDLAELAELHNWFKQLREVEIAGREG